ncbi:metal-dependent hydrolase [Halorarum halophilum]|uniref:Metal-dependent hydrolase n=1 Tax=Halorarum halophilum TaxID=2743090 RepID=A0A7D5GGE4_9EURY|nr:metal-dependent hydrolase [Halobaculum halophilum]QLG29028.1 metal-dependent hydrolase [Halobaculum halophilum]
MNKRGHIVNAVLLGAGIGYLLEPSGSIATLRSVFVVGIPIVLGALFPDIDTEFGTHRKTFHNVWVLAIFVAFPYYTGNLQYVWLGIATHYALDLLGNVKGMAVLYPYPEMYDIPVGVPVTSKWADVVTLLVTAFELAVVAGLVHVGRAELLRNPTLTTVVDSLPV